MLERDTYNHDKLEAEKDAGNLVNYFFRNGCNISKNQKDNSLRITSNNEKVSTGNNDYKSYLMHIDIKKDGSVWVFLKTKTGTCKEEQTKFELKYRKSNAKNNAELTTKGQVLGLLKNDEFKQQLSDRIKNKLICIFGGDFGDERNIEEKKYEYNINIKKPSHVNNSVNINKKNTYQRPYSGK